jgi:hypothetical protein
VLGLMSLNCSSSSNLRNWWIIPSYKNDLFLRGGIRRRIRENRGSRTSQHRATPPNIFESPFTGSPTPGANGPSLAPTCLQMGWDQQATPVRAGPNTPDTRCDDNRNAKDTKLPYKTQRVTQHTVTPIHGKLPLYVSTSLYRLP